MSVAHIAWSWDQTRSFVLTQAFSQSQNPCHALNLRVTTMKNSQSTQQDLLLPTSIKVMPSLSPYWPMSYLISLDNISATLTFSKVTEITHHYKNLPRTRQIIYQKWSKCLCCYKREGGWGQETEDLQLIVDKSSLFTCINKLTCITCIYVSKIHKKVDPCRHSVPVKRLDSTMIFLIFYYFTNFVF